jgi:hypothetical protein
VAADRHPGHQLAANKLGVALDLAANHEERGRCLPLGEDGQDLLGGVRPGAVVEGERHRQRPWVPTGRTEGDRHHTA